MSKTFYCPNCGGPLEYDGGEKLTVQCPSCSKTVSVPEEFRQVNFALRPDPFQITPLVFTTRHAIEEKLREKRQEARSKQHEHHLPRKPHQGDE